MSMAWEIERRFLVRAGETVAPGPGRHLRQGYVVHGDPSVRIRTGEARGAVLTCKSGSGIRRSEVETVVPEEVADALFRAAGSQVLEKVRWQLGPWTLDRFLGALEGLHLLEIELEREDEPLPEPPEGVQVLREVTDDGRFVSGQLARMKDEDRRELVKMAYEEVLGC
ncbi:MAG TPA: hypothetical protein VFQ22_08875 [Longimicrobiales bacterium]|nr:hypothetical protein [Longimicrobiales bacterium]